MPSDAGVLRQESDDASHRHEVLNALRPMQPRPPLVTSPEARAALERARRQRPDRLGGFWVGHHRPQALAAAAWQAEPERLVRQGPTSLTSDGKVKGRVRTAPGPTVPGWGTSDRRKGQRRAGTRSAGVDAGLVRCGMHDCCTPAWAAAVSRWAALWGALEAAQDVLAPRGVALDTTTRRTLASRDATRARLGQQVAHPACADTVAGRRVVISGRVPIFPVRLPAEQGVQWPSVSTSSTDPLCSRTATGVWLRHWRDTKRDWTLSSGD